MQKSTTKKAAKRKTLLLRAKFMGFYGVIISKRREGTIIKRNIRKLCMHVIMTLFVVFLFPALLSSPLSLPSEGRNNNKLP